MAHMLRKYLSNRGSALFMVISTMTALIISCMAMYFTMVSARESQYAVFSQMQTTQTAVSLKDVILNSFSPESGNADGNALFEKILKLDKGESITTDANGFMALDPNKETGKTPAEIGAYSVTITCLDKDAATGKMIFDILAMASFNGSRDAVHFTFDYDPNDPDPPGEDGAGGDAELFAATGYIPHDAYINGGYYLTNVFYDTQYTYMGTFANSGNNRIALNLNTGGDLMMSSNAMTLVHEPNNEAIKAEEANKVGPVTWAIRGNFYSNFGNDFDERGGSQIFVGGDFICAGNNAFFMKKDDNYTGTVKLGDHISVYINGDFQYCNANLKDYVWYFVNGNVTGTMNDLPSHSRIFVTGATEAERKAKVSSNDKLVGVVEEWPIDKWPEHMWDGKDKIDIPLTYDQAMKELAKRTKTIDYYKWDLSENTKESDANQHINIRMNATDVPWNDPTTGKTYDAMAGTYVIAYPGSESASLVTGNKENGVVGKAFIIDSVISRDGSSNAAPAVLIDTGDDPNNIITLKLSDVTGEKEFSWFVNGGEIPTGQPDGSQKTMRLVLTKGRGTVLIDIPKNITYRNAAYSFTGHLGWWAVIGGTVNTTPNGHITFLGVKSDSKLSPEIVKYVHKTCGDGDGCVFTKTDSSIDCAGCGGKLKQVTCSVHGDVNKYCSTCFEDKNDRTDWCVNHVDVVEVDKKYSTLDSTTKDWLKDSKGTVYPNTNFMLVSCDESIDINFARDRYNTYLNYAAFCGFVYAPYLSFMADGEDAGGGKLRLCGGMTVGDYTLNGFESYIGCYPDKMPNEIAALGGGSMAGGKLEGTAKSWKIRPGGYV